MKYFLDGVGLDSGQTRRGFLNAVAAGIGLSQIGTVSAEFENLESPISAAKGSSSKPPAYPEDPFMQPAFGTQFLKSNSRKGYEDVSREQKLRTLLDLHPKVLAFDQLSTYMDGELRNLQGQREQFEIAETLGCPATSGWNVNIKASEEEASKRYGPLLEEKDWRYPDGTPLESPHGILGETFDGDPHQISFTFNTLGTPSVFAPGGLDLTIEATATRLKQGYSGFFVDGVGVFRFRGLDFSRWARAAFRSHLQSLPNERLSNLGIENPGSFDIREYLRSNGLTPDDGENPLEDAVFREYLLHHHEGIDAWYDQYRAAVKQRFPDRMEANEVALYANQFTGHFGNPQAANVYVSDSLDIIYTELFPRTDPPVDVNYKTMRSVGNFSKPVVGKGTLTSISDEKLGDIDPPTPNPNLLRFQVAEAYAAGARFQLPLTARSAFSEKNSVTNWINPDGSIPKGLQDFADFLWAHERFLSDLSPSGDVAIVWSLPTRIWRHEPGWSIGERKSPRIDSFIGTATLLREAGITYDVLTFGHPRLWDDTEQLDRLSNYDAVVLPAIESITDDQVAELEAYLDNGGVVINSGAIPGRDGFYEPRDDMVSVLSDNNATILETDPGRQRRQNGETNGALVDALGGYGIRPVIKNNESVAVHAHTQSGPKRAILQLVNYDYDPTTDSFESKSGIELRIPSNGFDDPVARYYSPQRQEGLEISRGGKGPIVTVPELREWGIVVIAENGEDFVEGDSQAAKSRIENAQQKLDTARKAGKEEQDGFIIAESKLEAAETALNYDAFEQTISMADEAIQAINPLVATPSTVSQPRDNEARTTSPSEPSDESTDLQTSAQDTGGAATDMTSKNGPGFTLLSAIAGISIFVWQIFRGEEEE